MIKKYKANFKYGFEISEVEIERETKCFVFLSKEFQTNYWSNKELKYGNGVAYFDTWLEAYDKIESTLQQKLRWSEEHMIATENTLKDFRAKHKAM